jgi:hypothetical protein
LILSRGRDLNQKKMVLAKSRSLAKKEYWFGQEIKV